MDSDRAGLGGAGVTSRRWVVVDGFHKVSFSSRKAALAAKNEAN